MGKPATPAPPDYQAAAVAQGESGIANIEAQTAANRPNQYTPFGSSEWSQDAQGNWSQDITLEPTSQQTLENQQGVDLSKSELGLHMTDRLMNEQGQPMDWGQFAAPGGSVAPGQYDDPRKYYNKAGTAIYDKATSRLDPMWEQRTQAADIKLRNQGIRPGDEAYDTAMRNLEMDKTDAYGQASYDATMGAGAEAGRMHGMDLAGGAQTFGEAMGSSKYDTQLRQQSIVEEMTRRGFSLNEINAAMSGGQVAMPSMPGFSQAGSAAPTNYLGAADMGWGASMDQYGMDSAASNALYGNLGSMVGGAMSFSDRRLKTDIVSIGDGWYSYKLFGHIPTIGVMADEQPQAVVAHWSGFDMVNYGNL